MMAGLAVGAALGAVAAYLIFTEHGRRTVDNMEATLEDATAALEKFRRALRKSDDIVRQARGVVEDTWAVLKGQGPSATV
jgi:hypothetical protein